MKDKILELGRDLHDEKLQSVLEELDLIKYYKMAELLEDEKLQKQDAPDYYVLGFNSGEVIDGLDENQKISRQALFQRLDFYYEGYRLKNKRNREKILGKLETYYTRLRPNITGDIETLYWYYKGLSKKRHYDEYLKQGGLASRFNKDVEPESKYKKYYLTLANTGVPKDLDEAEYKAARSGFFRYKKFKVDQAILTDDYSELGWLNATDEYVDKRRVELKEDILRLNEKYQNKVNKMAYIEDGLGHYGIREFIKKVIK